MIITKLRPLNPKSADTKYTGSEPEWNSQPTPDQRQSRLISAFNWYNYHYNRREARQLVIDWLVRNDRAAQARDFARVPENSMQSTTGWLCRMELRGLELTEQERDIIEKAIDDHLRATRSVRAATQAAEPAAPRVTIQDRLRDRAIEAAGEIEGMYDDMIRSGARISADHKPMAVIRGINVAPQLVNEIASSWRERLQELELVALGRDSQLVEGYRNFTKTQVKNLVKFAETVIADCASYVQIKKTERAPRRKKPVSAEKLTQRFRYLRESEELRLKSEPVTKLVGAQEAWLYDTKKRKLIYVVADTHVGTITVKGTALIGFDATNSVQKTLRRPAEQIRALLTGGVANTRKFFKDIKATEVKFNGRSNENLLLLKIR